MRNKIERILFDAVTPVAVVSSTDANPAVVTATAHGFTTGQRILIFGHTTNTTINGIWIVTVLTANTFTLTDEFTGAVVVGAGGGAGAGGVTMIAPPAILVEDLDTYEIQIGTSGTATVTFKVAISAGRLLNQANMLTPRKDLPNFGATVTPANPWSYAQLIETIDFTIDDGNTGLVVAGTDIQKIIQVNNEGAKWLTLIPISWTAGVITAKFIGYYI